MIILWENEIIYDFTIILESKIKKLKEEREINIRGYIKQNVINNVLEL